MCCIHVHPSLSCVSPGAEGGWVLESGVCRVHPGRGQLLSVKRQSEGTGVRSSTTRKICRRSLGHHRSKAPLLSGMQGGDPPLQPPSPPASPCLGGHWEGCPSEQACPLLKPRPPLFAQACKPSLPKPPQNSALGTPD